MVFLTTYSTTDSVLKLVGLIILCFIIIAASFFTTRFIGQKQLGTYGGSNFESLEVYRLSTNKYLQLIRVGKRYLVLAVSKDNVTLLAELTEGEFEQKIKGEKKSFKDILGQMNKGA